MERIVVSGDGSLSPRVSKEKVWSEEAKYGVHLKDPRTVPGIYEEFIAALPNSQRPKKTDH